MEDPKEQQVVQARERLSRLSMDLCQLFSAPLVASMFLGIAVSLLRERYGNERAADYLRESAEELENRNYETTLLS